MFPERLKELRERIGLTKTEVGSILGIDRSQYGHYEHNYVTIPIKHLITLCNYYDVSLDYIFEFANIRQYNDINKEIECINKEILDLKGVKFCSICNNKIPTDAEFCPKCRK